MEKQAGILSVEIWNTDTFKWKDFYWQLTCFTIIIIVVIIIIVIIIIIIII